MEYLPLETCRHGDLVASHCQDYAAGNSCTPQLGALELDPKDWPGTARDLLNLLLCKMMVCWLQGDEHDEKLARLSISIQANGTYSQQQCGLFDRKEGAITAM